MFVPRSCSTPGCSGLLRPASVSQRCATCVKQSWNARRGMTHDAQHLSLGSATGQITNKPRKSVSWADEVEKKKPETRKCVVAAAQDAHAEAGPTNVVPPDAMDVDPATCVAPLLGCAPGASTSSPNFNPNKPSESSDDGAKATVPIIAASSETQDVLIEQVMEDDAPISGWDSDLTELSLDEEDLPDSNETSSDSDTPLADKMRYRPPIIIRIPARPQQLQALSTVKCSYIRCANLMPIGSKYKTCERCRAKFREYTRRRNEALQDAQYSSGGNRDDNKFLSVAASRGLVVGGARFCIGESCNRIIPPGHEYKPSLCYRCRVTVLQTLVRSLPPDSENLEKAASRLAALESRNPATRRSTRDAHSPQRCLLYDCGMIRDVRKEVDKCSQCLDPNFLARAVGHQVPSRMAPPEKVCSLHQCRSF